MKVDGRKLRLYGVTDRSWLFGRALSEDVRKALDGGVTFLQLREKDLSEEEFLKEAKQLKELVKEYDVPLIINDNVMIAKECDADGVHIGQDDAKIEDARKILGPDKIIGVSAHTVEEALRAQEQGADYLGVGAVFGSSTKTNVCQMPKETLQAICKAVQIPVVAIGGITKDRIPYLKGTGVDGVAVVSAIFAQKDIEKAAKELLEEVNHL
ncbi:MAG: thiamine phosphate synthase [Lachnospiraceae bacterium]|nr:thiamine phosphate synthase [Lachnospiraceae bacterium]